MKVNGINSVGFTGNATNKNDKKRNLGENIGTGLGVATAAYSARKLYKTGHLQAAMASIKESGLSTNKFIGRVALGIAINSVGFIAAGRWLGAGVDALVGAARRSPKEEAKVL